MQLIKKNNELESIYEKIRIQDSALYKGHSEYCKWLHEIRMYKFKLNNLKQEHTILIGSYKTVEVLRQEVHNLSREVMKEKTKVGTS